MSMFVLITAFINVYKYLFYSNLYRYLEMIIVGY